MSKLRETLNLAKHALESANVNHALIGGLALGNYAVHRSTIDVDLLVDGQKRDVAKQALINAGFTLSAETEEVLHFSGVGLLDLLLANREPTQNMLTQAKTVEGLNIKCVGIEDIIGLKIQAYVNNPKRALQDKADIAALISHNPELDWNKVKYYADLFKEWNTIQDIQKADKL